MIDIQNHIDANPKIMLGKPIVKGTRITVELVLQKMANGYVYDEILEMYPNLEMKDIYAVIAYAAKVIANEEVIKAA